MVSYFDKALTMQNDFHVQYVKVCFPCSVHLYKINADDLNNFERNYFKTNSTNCITSENGIKYKVTFAKHASSSSNAMVAIPDHAKCVECVIGQPEVRGLKRVCPAVMHMNVPVQGTYSNVHAYYSNNI